MKKSLINWWPNLSKICNIFPYKNFDISSCVHYKIHDEFMAKFMMNSQKKFFNPLKNLSQSDGKINDSWGKIEKYL